jgi:hypothetical protein
MNADTSGDDGTPELLKGLAGAKSYYFLYLDMRRGTLSWVDQLNVSCMPFVCIDPFLCVGPFYHTTYHSVLAWTLYVIINGRLKACFCLLQMTHRFKGQNLL